MGSGIRGRKIPEDGTIRDELIRKFLTFCKMFACSLVFATIKNQEKLVRMKREVYNVTLDEC